MKNRIDIVLDAVFNSDKHALGLICFEVDVTGVTQKEYDLYAPSYDIRLDMIAFELSWIIYTKNHPQPNPQDFKSFVKYDNRGRELFKKAREIAESKLPRDISLNKLRKVSRYVRIKEEPLKFITAFLIATLLLFTVVLCTAFLR